MDEFDRASFTEPVEMSNDSEGDSARQHVEDVPTFGCLVFPFKIDEAEFPMF